ncbi:hypothetical protein KR018_006569 [Drosophila ironensis]|nr:hypothetical protein KR018_006569 [Drosophila ironensis]
MVTLKNSRTLPSSGRCLYRIMACMCRDSRAISRLAGRHLGALSHIEQMLQVQPRKDRYNILAVEKVQAILPDSGSQDTGWLTVSRSLVVAMEKRIRLVLCLLAEFLRPVNLRLVLRILNPFGHSWNSACEEYEEDGNEEAASQVGAEAEGKAESIPMLVELGSMDD